MNVFEKWEWEYECWKVDRQNGDLYLCPAKPHGYDLWRQGVDPLNLDDTTGQAPCQGQNLVPADWTSDARPVPLPAHPLSQTILPL